MDSITLASSYPWTHSEAQASRISDRKRKGSGFLYLESKIDECSTPAKSILLDLLGDGFADDEAANSGAMLSSFKMANYFSKRMPRDLVFETICKTIEEGPTGSCGAKAIIKAAAPKVKPGTVPAHMDAKEIILSALLFLSTNGHIEAVNQSDDQEKRTYRMLPLQQRQQQPTLDSLEAIFTQSPQAREKFCPLGLTPHAEGPLLMRGVIPASAMAKKRGGAKKQATSTNSLPGQTNEDHGVN